MHVRAACDVASRDMVQTCPKSLHAHQEGGLKSVVEYHREEKMEIQEQLEALERERELIQCDLNNARSKGRCAIGVGRRGWRRDGCVVSL